MPVVLARNELWIKKFHLEREDRKIMSDKSRSGLLNWCLYCSVVLAVAAQEVQWDHNGYVLFCLCMGECYQGNLPWSFLTSFTGVPPTSCLSHTRLYALDLDVAPEMSKTATNEMTLLSLVLHSCFFLLFCRQVRKSSWPFPGRHGIRKDAQQNTNFTPV